MLWWIFEVHNFLLQLVKILFISRYNKPVQLSYVNLFFQVSIDKWALHIHRIPFRAFPSFEEKKNEQPHIRQPRKINQKVYAFFLKESICHQLCSEHLFAPHEPVFSSETHFNFITWRPLGSRKGFHVPISLSDLNPSFKSSMYFCFDGPEMDSLKLLGTSLDKIGHAVCMSISRFASSLLHISQAFFQLSIEVWAELLACILEILVLPGHFMVPHGGWKLLDDDTLLCMGAVIGIGVGSGSIICGDVLSSIWSMSNNSSMLKLLNSIVVWSYVVEVGSIH